MVMTMSQAGALGARVTAEQRRQPERDAKIVAMRDAGRSFVEIGAHFGVSRQRAQQIYARETKDRAAA